MLITMLQIRITRSFSKSLILSTCSTTSLYTIAKSSKLEAFHQSSSTRSSTFKNPSTSAICKNQPLTTLRGRKKLFPICDLQSLLWSKTLFQCYKSYLHSPSRFISQRHTKTTFWVLREKEILTREKKKSVFNNFSKMFFKYL